MIGADRQGVVEAEPASMATQLAPACLSVDAVDYRGRGKKPDSDKDTDIMGGDASRGRGTDRTNPAGWQHDDGRIGWASGHLLARQLGGTGRYRRNLVKMYDMANSVVMGATRRSFGTGSTEVKRSSTRPFPNTKAATPYPKTIDLYALGSSGSFSHWTVYNTPDGLPPANGVAP
ncbi:DNA/RNA non-specific endonuclease [Streptomyces antibioticus]|uniref:DNA/RNA non-specific endonuclease n=1 Tax=Streptomyces antibioticus TaxID=1890 RepID=UPI002253137E|nr:DNA/RNA non-specific endonuclease [Streptomyces antibioticus]MCX4743787.1 DNA/RNA non-specific endonuclease [Streptomyces antibioticus]